jgi:hypothetical protein
MQLKAELKALTKLTIEGYYFGNYEGPKQN